MQKQGNSLIELMMGIEALRMNITELKNVIVSINEGKRQLTDIINYLPDTIGLSRKIVK